MLTLQTKCASSKNLSSMTEVPKEGKQLFLVRFLINKLSDCESYSLTKK